jgi:hypothetical protein
MLAISLLSACASQWGNTAISEDGRNSPSQDGVSVDEKKIAPQDSGDVKSPDETELLPAESIWPDIFAV